MRGNLGHGMSVEISARVVARQRDRRQLRLRDQGQQHRHVSLWNNTVVNNGRAINIVQDDRNPANLSTPGHDPRRPGPDPTMSWINGPIEVHNNILSASKSGNCLLCVEDYSGRFTAKQMRVHASGNIYQRRNRSSPTWAVVWSRGSGNPAVFETVGQFRRATGQEARHADLVGVRAVTSSLRATQRVRGHVAGVAIRLGRDLAASLGRRTGDRHLGAWFG